ncbi:MAG: hypothetical protein LBN95_02010 [Prevotellaceae bacterium]|jgi:hypothetical protein|nr:hypothetical protein [Prevotellaceae bacterium]
MNYKLFFKLISIIFHPTIIPLYCALIFVNIEPYSYYYELIYKIIIVSAVAIFTLIIPSLALLIMRKTGLISSIYLSNRKERLPIYIISLFSAICCVQGLNYLKVEPVFVLIFSCALMSIVALSIINFWWKISAHACGVGILCGAVFSLAFFLGSNPVTLFCAVILAAGLTITSRLILQAHTPAQLIAGFFNGLFFSLLPTLFY